MVALLEQCLEKVNYPLPILFNVAILQTVSAKSLHQKSSKNFTIL
jgi:hypothetical protein